MPHTGGLVSWVRVRTEQLNVYLDTSKTSFLADKYL